MNNVGAELPSRRQAESLLAFLPEFERPGRTFFLNTTEPEGEFANLPYPVYPDDVTAFFMKLGLSPWADFNYRSTNTERFIEQPDRLSTASWPEVRAVLTHCSRGERFSDGFWCHVLEHGVVQAALRRLDVLTREADDEDSD